MFLTSHQSPNFNERADASPAILLFHYTGMRTAEEALQRLCDPESQVSAHYFIDENGDIYQLVKEEKRAWHAGKAYWDGITDINSASIGIEIVNPGHEFGYRTFPEKQVAAVKDLSLDIIARHTIRATNILGHSDVAPLRKQDPGEFFPWQDLAAAGIGLWPEPLSMDADAAHELAHENDLLYDLLVEIGYNPEIPFDGLWEAFCRRYVPEAFRHDDFEERKVQGVQRLLALGHAVRTVKLEEKA